MDTHWFRAAAPLEVKIWKVKWDEPQEANMTKSCDDRTGKRVFIRI
ncbi:hypothetical protein PRIPAC_70138 [Pristionchus pacificus]|uniref:Uncharacterized protein n=1 Tax=Pristionchus pacificus TaxID=54126 RepID=A0A2A6C7L9_PRIPA|nr:hypothetical protein PRIPAC_70138 [Pristionchus pacificus]|eukprot:PDM74174.1 hypothetical protein PRIPAC_41530 [Pristionchus pacificus]